MNNQNRKPVDFDELWPGRFLKAGLFQGKKPTLTITDVDREELEGDKGKKIKGVVSFQQTPMQLALNKTNGICLRAMFGRKLADWFGKRVTLFADKWNGDDCIRVWGSPDIDRDMQVEIRLPRRAPYMMTMHAREPNQQRQQPPDPDPDDYDEMDPDPSEFDNDGSVKR